jgi:catalase
VQRQLAHFTKVDPEYDADVAKAQGVKPKSPAMT